MYTQFKKQVERDGVRQLDYLYDKNKDLVSEYNDIKHTK